MMEFGPLGFGRRSRAGLDLYPLAADMANRIRIVEWRHL